MDRRSWLWRRKSSEKSPGETESSGSISSHSERFSDDQAYSNQNTQSPEVTSKAVPNDEELDDNAKTLTEKLLAALLNISVKEEMVKQHAKVAEEAVSGWEKAETEVSALKQQLETVTQQNSALEDRVGNLDGALKECLRQLRQAREEQDQKIHEAVAKKTYELESTKSELEKQLAELQSQLQAAKAESITSVDSDLRPKLEAMEKENSALRLELFSRAQELELVTIERDLSTKAAETASKQHLDSIKKVAKLEAECRRLKEVARKAPPTNDHRSIAASSVYVESFTDSQSDYGERLYVVETDVRKVSGLETNECEQRHSSALGRNLLAPSVEINLMDDFLEMERLVALPETESGSFPDSGALSDQPHGEENPLKFELEAMINRTAELEEKLEKMELEKVEMDIALNEIQNQLKISKDRLDEANESRRVIELEFQSTKVDLKASKDRLEVAEMKLMELQIQLTMTDEARGEAEVELEAINVKKEVIESQLKVAEAESKRLLSKVSSLEEEVQKERALSGETIPKCRKLEEEISRMKYETELQKAARSNGELKLKQDKEMAVAATKLAECQKTIASLGRQLKSLATLEDFLMDSEKPLEIPKDGSQSLQDGMESRILHSSDSYLPKGDSEYSTIVENGRDEGSGRDVVFSEKSRNGFGKLFSRSKSRSRN